MPGTITTLPDLGKSFLRLQIFEELANCEHASIFAQIIRSNIRPWPAEAIQMVYDQLQDNYDLTAEIIGLKAATLITKLYA